MSAWEVDEPPAALDRMQTITPLLKYGRQGNPLTRNFQGRALWIAFGCGLCCVFVWHSQFCLLAVWLGGVWDRLGSPAVRGPHRAEMVHDQAEEAANRR